MRKTGGKNNGWIEGWQLYLPLSGDSPRNGDRGHVSKGPPRRQTRIRSTRRAKLSRKSLPANENRFRNKSQVNVYNIIGRCEVRTGDKTRITIARKLLIGRRGPFCGPLDPSVNKMAEGFVRGFTPDRSGTIHLRETFPDGDRKKISLNMEGNYSGLNFLPWKRNGIRFGIQFRKGQ